MTDKEKKILTWSIVIALILAIIIFYVVKYTNLPNVIKDKITGSNSNFNSAGGFIADYGDEINTDKILSFGDKSNNVVRLQSSINEIIDKYGYTITKLSTDGVYGMKTASALKYISQDTLKSGNVTINKVANLKKLPIIGGLNTGSNNVYPVGAASTTTSGL